MPKPSQLSQEDLKQAKSVLANGREVFIFTHLAFVAMLVAMMFFIFTGGRIGLVTGLSSLTAGIMLAFGAILSELGALTDSAIKRAKEIVAQDKAR